MSLKQNAQYHDKQNRGAENPQTNNAKWYLALFILIVLAIGMISFLYIRTHSESAESKNSGNSAATAEEKPELPGNIDQSEQETERKSGEAELGSQKKDIPNAPTDEAEAGSAEGAESAEKAAEAEAGSAEGSESAEKAAEEGTAEGAEFAEKAAEATAAAETEAAAAEAPAEATVPEVYPTAVDPNSYVCPYSGSAMITYSDYSAMKAANQDIFPCYTELCQMIINDMFAAKGMQFRNPNIQAYYEQKTWYQKAVQTYGACDFDTAYGRLNSIEHSNVNFMNEIQQTDPAYCVLIGQATDKSTAEAISNKVKDSYTIITEHYALLANEWQNIAGNGYYTCVGRYMTEAEAYMVRKTILEEYPDARVEYTGAHN